MNDLTASVHLKGQKVSYIPFEGCDKSLIQKGIVKSINFNDLTTVFVVFNCAGDWYDYENYTGQNTKVSQLTIGWHE